MKFSFARFSFGSRKMFALGSWWSMLALVGGTELMAKAIIDESSVTETVVVGSSDDARFSRLAEAFAYLNAHPERAIKVLIEPGVYREGGLRLKPRNASATVFEGAAPGEVVITGADVWTDWESEGEGRYSAAWPYEWGEHPYDEFYHIKDDLGRRVEVVRLNGERMTQVAAMETMQESTYFVDEEKDRLWLQMPAGTTPADFEVEVSIRGNLMWFRQVNNLVLRNLRFVDAANGAQRGDDRFAVAIFGNSEDREAILVPENASRNLLIEACEFSGSSGSGATMSSYQGATIKSTRFVDNGNAGAGISLFRELEVLGCAFDDNNWRIGGYGLFYDWAPAGIKFFRSANLVIEATSFRNNQAPGLWLDYQIENVVMNDITAENNYGAGVYIEASSGPFSLSNSVVRNNGFKSDGGTNHGGVLIAESRDVTISGSEIVDNGHGQIMIRTRPREGCGGFYSGKRFGGTVMNVMLLNNVIAGKTMVPEEAVRKEHYVAERQSGGLIMMSTYSRMPLYREDFLTTLWSENNTFSHADSTEVFSTGDDYGFDRIDFTAWQERYGQDLNSKFLPLAD